MRRRYINTKDAIAAISSATTMDIQIPSTPHTSGKSKIAAIWKTSVRRKEIAADTGPLFRAVKKPEPKIAKPAKRKEKENIRKPLRVIAISSAS